MSEVPSVSISIFEPAPLPAPDKPLPKAGEVVLTPGQKIALLKMRGSDWSEAILSKLERFGQAECTGADYRALASLRLAVCKGSFHVLTPAGRWRADRVARDIARESGIHAITIEFFPRSRGAASARCSCGWSTYRSRAIKSYASMLSADAQHHLRHVGEAS